MGYYLKLCYYPLLNNSYSDKPPDTSFTVWYNKDFGLCFEYLVFLALLGGVFGVVSAFYAGLKHTKFKRKRRAGILVLRGVISLSILVTYLVDFITSFWLSIGKPYSVTFSLIVLIIAWAIHLLYIWVVSVSVTHYGRGPVNINAVWIMLFVGTILQLRTTIRWRFHSEYYQRSSLPIKEAYFSNLSIITVYVLFGLQCLYGCTLLFKVSRVTGDNVTMYSPQLHSLNRDRSWTDDAEKSVQQHLISSEWTTDHVSNYGSLTTSYESGLTRVEDFGRLDASENGANLLSLLSFWWVGPLMRKGALGFLQKPDDLLQLPKSLGTSKLRRRFQKYRGVSESDSSDPSRIETRGRERTEHSSVRYDFPAFQTQGQATSSAQKEVKDTPESHSMSKQPSLLSSLSRAFGLHYYPLGVLKLVSDMLGFAGPLLLHALVSFMENGKEPMSHGYYYALGLFLATLSAALLNTHFTYQVNKVSLKIRAALVTEVYRKALSVSSCTLSEFSTGQIVNFMSTDCDRIVNFCASFHQFWSLPFQVIVSLGLLYQQVGLAFLGGLGFCLLLIPVNRWLAVKIGKLSSAMMAQKDQRVKVMSEILAGIRVIKFYAWENNFVRKILAYRSAELKSLKGRKYLDALCVYFWATTPVLISIITFTIYVLIGNTLTAAKIFTSLALFNILIGPLNAFPWVINGLMEAWVSSKRVNAFLQLQELDFSNYYSEWVESGSSGDGATPGNVSSSEGVTLVPASNEDGLQKSSVSGVSPGNVSSSEGVTLVPASKEDGLQKSSVSGVSPGNVSSSEGVTLVPASNEDGLQKSSVSSQYVVGLQHGSFTWSRPGEEGKKERPNVVAGNSAATTAPINVSVQDTEEVDDSATSGVVRCTITLADINLSIKPGQLIGVVGKVGAGKSSLLMAIAAEMRKTLGKVFVADVQDGFGLFTQESWIQHATLQENILFGQPYDAAKYRAVISATALEQDIQILPSGDRTEVGENGVTLSGGQKARVALARAIYQDKAVYLLDDPLAAVDAHVASHLYQHCINGLLKHKTRVLCTHHVRFLREADMIIYMEGGRVHYCGSPAEVLPLVEEIRDDKEDSTVHGDDIKSLSNSQEASTTSEDCVELTTEEVLVKEEEKAVGVVSFSVYYAYWCAVGYVLAPLILLALFLMQASRNVNDWWLSYWITHSNSTTNQSIMMLGTKSSDHLRYYLGIYGGLAAANSVFTLIRAFLYAYGGICAARLIHKRLLNSILMAPTSFFDTTPIGRIVNRFSSDIYAVDDSLPFILNILLAQLYGLLGTLAVTCYGLPWFTFLLLPLSLVYYNIQSYYRRTSRELKRLSTITLSPIYAHFSETLTGLCTIRALRASTRFMRENEQKLEVNQRANYGSYAVAQWLGIRLQMLGVAMVTGVAFIAVLEHHFNTVNPGLVGLAISYALSVTNLLSGVVTSFTETEKEMVSVERAMQYIKGAPTESRDGDIQPPSNWPSLGVVEFKNVVLTYREGLPSALKEVSFVTKPGEKIGVVGRTGAGKSSLFKALFRMVELSIGSVSIDGINIASLSLERLRSSLAIIPQDPFLFSGSIRENLDPCNKHTDDELWLVLEQCHLKDAVANLGNLDSEVEEKGRVFSVGQRQLVCLARALLTQAHVICIDEATASVDQQTDTMIQRTIREEFTASTVITIAHRIDTVLNSDRILVLEQGRVKEFASPHDLLDNTDSFFYSLYRQHKLNTTTSDTPS